MKTREFDPVLSAALRNELASLPTAAPEATRASRLRRPQVWVTAVTAVLLLVATIGVLRITATHDAPPARQVPITDPLTRITDPDDSEYLPSGVWTLLHRSGTGPGTFALEVPEGTSSVRPLLACSPAADARLTVGKWYGTRCDAAGATGYGDIPVTAGIQPITVQVPEGVRWRLAVIETPEEGTTYSTLQVEGATPALEDRVRYPAPEREDDVAVGIAHGTSGSTTGRLFAPVDELALVTSCRGTGGLVVTLSNGLRFGTDASPIPCGSGSPEAGAAGNDTARGYRDDGRLTYTVRPIGDAAWTATFSSRTEERLPYPSVSGTVVARTRGSSTESFGRLGRTGTFHVVVTCRGTGGLRVGAGAGTGTVYSPADSGADAWCTPGSARRTEYSVTVGPEEVPVQYSVEPHGDVLWTVTFLAE